MHNLLLFLFCCLTFIQCSNDDNLVGFSGTFMSYNETKCADPWGFISEQQTLVDVVSEYLGDNVQADIRSLEVSNEPSLAEDCEACSCLTGNQITILVREEDVALFEELGFVEEG